MKLVLLAVLAFGASGNENGPQMQINHYNYGDTTGLNTVNSYRAYGYTGCAEGLKIDTWVNAGLYLCGPGSSVPPASQTFDILANSCNQAKGYYLTSVSIQSLVPSIDDKAGKPTESSWSQAKYWAWQGDLQGFQNKDSVVAITGQPTVGSSWSDWGTNSNSNWAVAHSYTSWDHLVNGDATEGRQGGNNIYGITSRQLVALCINPRIKGIANGEWQVYKGQIAVATAGAPAGSVNPTPLANEFQWVQADEYQTCDDACAARSLGPCNYDAINSVKTGADIQKMVDAGAIQGRTWNTLGGVSDGTNDANAPYCYTLNDWCMNVGTGGTAAACDAPLNQPLRRLCACGTNQFVRLYRGSKGNTCDQFCENNVGGKCDNGWFQNLPKMTSQNQCNLFGDILGADTSGSEPSRFPQTSCIACNAASAANSDDYCRPGIHHSFQGRLPEGGDLIYTNDVGSYTCGGHYHYETTPICPCTGGNSNGGGYTSGAGRLGRFGSDNKIMLDNGHFVKCSGGLTIHGGGTQINCKKAFFDDDSVVNPSQMKFISDDSKATLLNIGNFFGCNEVGASWALYWNSPVGVPEYKYMGGQLISQGTGNQGRSASPQPESITDDFSLYGCEKGLVGTPVVGDSSFGNVICEPGTFWSGHHSGGSCDPCPNSAYSSSNNWRSCLPHTHINTCAAGMGNLVGASSTSPGTCSACPSHQWSTQGWYCQDHKTAASCTAGQEFNDSGKSATSDAVGCVACDLKPGTYNSLADAQSGRACTAKTTASSCNAGENLVGDGYTSQNAYCAACTGGTYNTQADAQSGRACAAYRTASECAAGQEFDDSNASASVNPTCVACAADKFNPLADASSGRACQTRAAQTDCKPGSRFTEGNTATDNTCTACGPGEFSDADGALTCTTWTAHNCLAGTYLVAGTPTADAKCEDCADGFFALVGSASCTAHTKGSTCTNRQKLTPGDKTTDAVCEDDTDLAPSEESGANIVKEGLAPCRDRGFMDTIESPELKKVEFDATNALKVTMEVDALATMQTITFTGTNGPLADSVTNFDAGTTANCQTTYVSGNMAWSDYKDALKLYDVATAGSLQYRAEVVVEAVAPYDPAMTKADYDAAVTKAWSGQNPRRRETRSVFQIYFLIPSTVEVAAQLTVNQPMPSPVGPDGPTTFDLPITINDLKETPHVDAMADVIRTVLGLGPGSVEETSRTGTDTDADGTPDAWDLDHDVTAPNNDELARVLAEVNDPDAFFEKVKDELQKRFPDLKDQDLPKDLPDGGSVGPTTVQADDVQMIDVKSTLNRDTLELTTTMDILTRTAYPWKFNTPTVSSKSPVTVAAHADNANTCNEANAPTCYQLWVLTFKYAKGLCGNTVGETVTMTFAYTNARSTAANPYTGPTINDVSSEIVLRSDLIQCAVQAGDVDLSSSISLSTFGDSGFANAQNTFDIATTAYFIATVDTANLPGVTLSGSTLKTVTTKQDGQCGAAACTAKSQYDVGLATPNVDGNVDVSVDNNADPLQTKFAVALANNIFDMSSFLSGGSVGLTISATITLTYQNAAGRRRRLMNLDPAQSLAKGGAVHKLYVKKPKHYGKTATICLDNTTKKACKKASSNFKKMKFFAPADGPCKWSSKKRECRHKQVVQKCADIRPRPKNQKQCETHNGCMAKLIGAKYKGCAGKFSG